MPKVVWKYKIPFHKPTAIINMPFGAQILHFAFQYGDPVIWALVDPSKEMAERRFCIVGTGHNIDKGGLQYIGTSIIADGRLVFHLFEY